MSRKIHSADELLRRYAEARSLLSGAQAQNLIAHSGGTCALLCSNRDCAGSPRRVLDDGIPRWHCTKCKKLWPIEVNHLGRRQFQDTRRGIVTIGEQRVRLGDFAVILKHVQEKLPCAFTAWYVHVLAPTFEATDERPAIGLGVYLEEVPARMVKLEREGAIDPLPVGQLTHYRVRSWIQSARDAAMSGVRVWNRSACA